MRIIDRLARRLAPPAPFQTPAEDDPRARFRALYGRDPVASTLSFSSVYVPPEMSGLVGDGATLPRVGRDLAMSVPAVKRGRDLTAGTLGTLPFRVLDERYRPQPWRLLRQPEVDVARSVTMTRTFEDMLFEGRSWWRITEFDGNWPSRVRRLEPRSVTVREDARVWVSRDGVTQGHSLELVPDALLIRIDSPNDPLLVAGARAIRAYLSLQRATTRNVEDPLPLGYLTPTGEIEPEDPEGVMDEFEDTLGRRAWPYIPAGLAPHVLQWDPEKLQLNAAKEAAVVELAQCMGVDPEEFGISTTTRTYANAEQRRLDLLDFTLLAYITAFEERMSMDDVTPPEWTANADYSGYLRSDTLSRLQTYKVGREVGTHDDQRISEIERIPVARVKAARALATPQPPAARPAPASRPEDRGQTRPSPQEAPVSTTDDRPAVKFADEGEEVLRVGFAMSEDVAQFRASRESRTIEGMVMPWNTVATARGFRWMFAPGSLHYADPGRVKLDRDHEYGSEFGRGIQFNNTTAGLVGKFRVAQGGEGDRLLGLAVDGVYDGLSAEAAFTVDSDGWTDHPTMSGVRYVHSATLRKVALTAMPAFDDARTTSVAASRKADQMLHCTTCGKDHAPGVACTAPTPAPAAAPFDPVKFAEQLTQGFANTMAETIKPLIEALPQPQGLNAQRAVVPAGRVEVVREEPVYLMNGRGNSFVRDAWKARTEGDHDARDRLIKFTKMTQDEADRAVQRPNEWAAQFAVTTGNAGQIIAPGYRPELFVTQLQRDRPLVNSVSRGTLQDATPFNIPGYVSSSGATATHVEGVNPTGGTLVLGIITVAPTGISGVYELTREIVDSANPAVDAIAMQAMQESYSQQTEALVYAELNGTNGQGGTITSGFVPSGAQARTTSGQGDELLAGVRLALADYPFRRFGRANRAHISQEATQAFASAVDSTGRPLLPFVGPQNAVGTSNASAGGYFIDGVTHEPTWSMTGNAAGDADVLHFNSNDVWAWESALLTFRFEERGGPARIDLALFGYFATRVLRPVGVSSVRHTAS